MHLQDMRYIWRARYKESDRKRLWTGKRGVGEHVSRSEKENQLTNGSEVM